MGVDEGVVGELRRLLGLTGYEARAYLAVLRGARRPREVAEASGVPVQRVYDVLARLERRGLVARSGEGYVAVDPVEALGSAAEALVVEARMRAEELRRLGELLRRVADAGESYVRLAPGLGEAVGAALEALRRCGRRAWVMVYKAAEKLGEPGLGAFLEAVLRGLPRGSRVLVAEGVAVPRWALGAARAAGVEVRRSPAVLFDLLLACDTVVIGLPSGGGDVVAVVVRHRGFARALEERLVEVWGQASPV